MNRLALLALVLLAAGCKEDVVNSPPVTLRVVLTTPNSGEDGSALVRLSGPVTPQSLAVIPSLQLWGAPVQSSTSQIALTGELTGGMIFTFQTEARYAGQFTATLREVANEETLELRDLTGYSLTIEQP
jgi:hypothetical protein